MQADTAARERALNTASERSDGDYVLYWMVAARRTAHSTALDVAVAAARRLGRPLLVLEALRVGYGWASDRLHAFVLQGMAANQAACAAHGVTYWPYVEPEAGAGRGLLEALAARACLVVTDDYPAFFVPRMQAAAARLDVRLLAVDGNGLLPMSLSTVTWPTAYAFRRHLQRNLAPQLARARWPSAEPLAGAVGAAQLPRGVARRWPAAAPSMSLARLPIDHAVAPVAELGGLPAARARLATFLDERLARYGERSHPDDDVASGLSFHLHFGHLGVHEIFGALARRERWQPAQLGTRATGQRDGFWHMSPPAEGFLDELVTWRELGYHFAARAPRHDQYESLPAWAQATLEAHARDRRAQVYDLATLEAARTHDELWNAAQRQLLTEGRMHNYLRMLWGKKILEWSPTPRAALAAMIQLNNRWAVDGRDPNSYSGIFWVLGRFDRPWAPERDIFGVIRYMSSANTLKKLHCRQYLARWAAL